MKSTCSLAPRLAVFVLAVWAGACASTPPTPQTDLSALARSFGEDGQGCAYAVRADGVLVHHGAAGLADVAAGTVLTPGDIFDVGSVSKSFTAAVILTLAENGALSLDDPVAAYVAGLPAWSAQVRIADLLYMRSGIPDFRVDTPGDGGWRDDRLRGSDLSPADPVSMALIMETIGGFADLDFAPGARYAYSNSNYMLLRAIAEAAGGAPFDAQMRAVAAHIAGIEARAPLYREGLRQPLSRVAGYDVALDGGSAPSRSHWDVLGASSVWLSVEELARWGEGLMANSAWFQRQSAIGVLRYPDADSDLGYAAGLMTMRRAGELIVYHLGGTEGFSSGLFMRPAHGEVLAFSCNMSPELFFTRAAAGEARALFAQARELVFLAAWLDGASPAQ